MGKCQYHLCDRSDGNHECKFCLFFFCKKHLRAKPPGMPRFDRAGVEWELLMQEYRKQGHPCAPFYDHWQANVRSEEEKYSAALDRILSAKLASRTNFSDVSSTPYPVHTHNDTTVNKNHSSAETRAKGSTNPQDGRDEEQFKSKISDYVILAGAVFLVILIVFQGDRIATFLTEQSVTCADGTITGVCSKDKPFFCLNGALIKDEAKCGCPEGYKFNDARCEEIKNCSDGTEYATCVYGDEPWYCKDGAIVERASICGCPYDTVKQGEGCVSVYFTNPKDIKLKYILNGKTQELTVVAYKGLSAYLAGLSRFYYCDPNCPTENELALRYLDESHQTELLLYIVQKIREITPNENDQARIAISLVQKIPYDWAGFKGNTLNSRYPYEVIYDRAGVCGEKSKLLAFLLRELGFGVVLFSYPEQSHEAVGIKCRPEYGLGNSGYCFVETTSPTIITDSSNDYVNVGKLSSTPEVIHISEGKSFDANPEYFDVAELNRIEKLGRVLDDYNYARWQALVKKYGLLEN